MDPQSRTGSRPHKNKPADTKVSQLDRQSVLDGRVQALARARDGANANVLSDEDLLASRRQMIPDNGLDQDLWIFGYGSLVWNPMIEFDRRLQGRAHGWHRRFCLRTHIGRGSPEQPGLVLGLDRGGSVNGLLFRIPADQTRHECDLLWRREMLNNSYRPVWISVQTPEGAKKALSFAIRRDGPAYVPPMQLEEASRIIAVASGFIGPCSDYLFETHRALAEWGIADPQMARLVELVRAAQTHR